MSSDRHRIRQQNLRTLVLREKTQKVFAIKHGLAPNHLSQMLRPLKSKNWRGVGDDTVEKLQSDKTLGLSKGWMDVDHTAETAPPDLRPSIVEAAENPSWNQLRSMRMALQSLLSALHAHRPDIAEEVAMDIVETAGTEFASHGLLGLFVGILRPDHDTPATAPRETQPHRSSKASKHATAASK